MTLARILAVAVAAASLGACTAGPPTSVDPEPSGVDQDSSEGTDALLLTRMKVPGYPDTGTLPNRLSIEGSVVSTRMDCSAGDRRPNDVPMRWHLAGKELPAIASTLTENLRGERAVVINQSRNIASVLILDKADSLIGDWRLYRYGEGWAWDSMRYCDGKSERMIIT